MIKSTVYLLRLLFLAGIFSLAYYNLACRDPHEYEPQDSLLPPPEPPILVSPPDGFVRMPSPDSNRLSLAWTPVADAETYEIRFAGESTGTWTVLYDTNAFSLRLEIEQGVYLLDRFTWHVRAGNGKWQYYTDWTAPGHFEVRLKPPPPTPVFPPDDTTLVFDSLPVDLKIEWAIVQDEEYYDLLVFLDSFPIAETRLYTNSYHCLIDTAVAYYWQVRAGSSHWQYFSDWSQLWKFEVTTVKR